MTTTPTPGTEPSGDKPPASLDVAREKKRARDRKSARRTYTKNKYKELVAGIFGGVGTGLMLVDPYCGEILLTRSERVAEAVAELAMANDWVARTLESFGKVAGGTTLAIAFADVAVPIAAHHHLIKPEIAQLLGAPPLPSTEPPTVHAPAPSPAAVDRADAPAPV